MSALEEYEALPTGAPRSLTKVRADAAIAELEDALEGEQDHNAYLEEELEKARHCRWCGALIEKCPYCGEEPHVQP